VAVITPAGRLAVREQEIPALKDGQVLVQVRASLISPGTEMAGVQARRDKPDPEAKDQPFGYANAGVVLAVRGDCRGLAPGMRVACLGSGAALHADHAVVPSNLVQALPEGVTFEQGCYACLGATALQSVRRADPRLGEYGLVIGLGIVGNLAAQLGALCGARMAAWETIPFRIGIARACGIGDCFDATAVDAVAATRALTAGYGLEFAIFAFGGSAARAYESTGKCMCQSEDGHMMGRVVLVGGCELTLKGGAWNGNIDIRVSSRTGPGYHDPAYELGRDYPKVFVPFDTRRNVAEILRLIAERRLQVEPMTTHRMPLERCDEAADLLLAAPDSALGVIFEMGPER
jgi:threonine dehydrogenase-like Zn-dependent dehydrogenase